MWLAIILAAFTTGEVVWEQELHCDSYRTSRLFLEAYRLTGSNSASFFAIAGTEGQDCSTTDSKSLYVGEEASHIIRGYRFTIHKIWMEKEGVVRYMITRIPLEDT